MSSNTGASVANKRLLVQLVRSFLGRDAKTFGLERPNASSCSIVVTLHGRVGGMEERRTIEETACRVPSVRDVGE
jgi:hypothetical protein